MKTPVYLLLIYNSIFIGLIYQFVFLKINKMKTEHIFYMLSLSIVMIIVCGLLGSACINGFELNKIGFYSIGGLFGYGLSAFMITKIIKEKNNLIYKSTALTIPLMYGVSKIACVYATCCNGIEYSGFLAVTSKYHDGTFFPIQIIEVIIFILLFAFLNYLNIKKKAKNIILISIISSAMFKMLLDFLRFDHTNRFYISINQIICLLIIGIAIIFNNYKKKKNNN